MKTLLLSTRYGIDSKLVMKAAVNAGWNVKRVFNYEYTPSPEEDIYLYGEVLWCDIMAERLNLNFIDAPLNFVPSLDEIFRSRNIVLSNAGTKELPKEFYHRFVKSAEEKKLFIKPARDKCFEARVYDPEEWVPDYVEPDTPILISEPVEYILEIRGFILDGKLVTASPYMRDMKPIEIIVPEDSYWDNIDEFYLSGSGWVTWHYYKFMDILLSNTEGIPKTCVIDCGFCDNRKGFNGWQVIEINNAHTSGLYDCDPEEVLKCVEASKIVS